MPLGLRRALERTHVLALIRMGRRLRLSARQQRKARRAVRHWKRLGRPVPPPDLVKQKLVRAAAVECRVSVFVETGTFRGDMVEAMRRGCREVISIELDRERYERAVVRFAGCRNVTLIHGDSAQMLPAVLETLREPALFWLDGHYSGPGTARGDTDTPILAELTHVLGHGITGHVILVDDARLFDGAHDYPTLEAVEQHVRRIRPQVSVQVKSDMIEIGFPA